MSKKLEIGQRWRWNCPLNCCDYIVEVIMVRDYAYADLKLLKIIKNGNFGFGAKEGEKLTNWKMTIPNCWTILPRQEKPEETKEEK